MKRILTLLILSTLLFVAWGRTYRVLAIGNSFSQDAIEQNLYELALAQGDTLVIGNAYIPGCQIDLHYENILSDKQAYSYRKIVDGIKTITDKTSLSSIINDEQWDIISLQQASHFSGLQSTYTNLPNLKHEVEKLMPNKDAEIVWHMTWAYAKDSQHSGFVNYGNSQEIMNDSIYCAITVQIPYSDIKRIIPAGPAIQAARELLGDILNSDGYHLSPLGRYVAACTWCEFLTGQNITDNPYYPEQLTDDQASKARQAAHTALNGFVN